MKTVLINVDSDASAKLLMQLAKKLRFKARLLNKEQREDNALLALMETRKDDKTVSIKKTYEILRKVK